MNQGSRRGRAFFLCYAERGCYNAHKRIGLGGEVERTRTTREWLESLDPTAFLEISAAISDIQRDRRETRRRKLEDRRAGARDRGRGGRYIRLERVKCGKKGCKKCTGEHPQLHGPYWYLYRPKKSGDGRTSEYVGKTLSEELAREFNIPEDQRVAG